MIYLFYLNYTCLINGYVILIIEDFYHFDFIWGSILSWPVCNISIGVWSTSFWLFEDFLVRELVYCWEFNWLKFQYLNVYILAIYPQMTKSSFMPMSMLGIDHNLGIHSYYISIILYDFTPKCPKSYASHK